MDIFKQKRFMAWVIVLLVTLNVTTIVLLWIGRPPRRVSDGPPDQKERGQVRLQRLLKEELGFDDAQADKFLELHRLHEERLEPLEEEIRFLKKEMFDQALGDEEQLMLSDSLLNLMQAKQAELEKATFQFLLNLRTMCTPEQQDKLQMLIHDMLRPPNAPPGGRRQMPPPGGERPPRRPPEQ